MAGWMWLIPFLAVVIEVVLVRGAMRYARRLNTQWRDGLAAASEVAIMVYDPITESERVWCRYPAPETRECIEAMNSAFRPLLLFWREGEERPDRREVREKAEREWALRMAGPLTPRPKLAARGIVTPPGGRVYTTPHTFAIGFDTRRAALAFQQRLQRQGKTCTVIDNVVYQPWE